MAGIRPIHVDWEAARAAVTRFAALPPEEQARRLDRLEAALQRSIDGARIRIERTEGE